jgi:hypothetical protein
VLHGSWNEEVLRTTGHVTNKAHVWFPHTRFQFVSEHIFCMHEEFGVGKNNQSRGGMVWMAALEGVHNATLEHSILDRVNLIRTVLNR